ncbi:unnamed protein product [Brassica rapa subsp. trilocularis]
MKQEPTEGETLGGEQKRKAQQTKKKSTPCETVGQPAERNAIRKKRGVGEEEQTDITCFTSSETVCG